MSETCGLERSLLHLIKLVARADRHTGGKSPLVDAFLRVMHHDKLAQAHGQAVADAMRAAGAAAVRTKPQMSPAVFRNAPYGIRWQPFLNGVPGKTLLPAFSIRFISGDSMVRSDPYISLAIFEYRPNHISTGTFLEGIVGEYISIIPANPVHRSKPQMPLAIFHHRPHRCAVALRGTVPG